MSVASSLKTTPAEPPHCPPPAIDGLVPFSNVDWPRQLAAVMFVAGCPWRCHYYHNPHLQTQARTLDWNDIFAFLQRRTDLPDTVILSDGEPLSEPHLPQLIRDVRALGYKIGLHTGGIYPARLTDVLPRLDWVGLDVKANVPHYDALTDRRGSAAPVDTYLDLLLQSGGAFERRTTRHPDWLPEPQLLALAQDLSRHGVKHYALQAYRSAPGTPATALPNEGTQRALATSFSSFYCRWHYARPPQRGRSAQVQSAVPGLRRR